MARSGPVWATSCDKSVLPSATAAAFGCTPRLPGFDETFGGLMTSARSVNNIGVGPGADAFLDSHSATQHPLAGLHVLAAAVADFTSVPSWEHTYTDAYPSARASVAADDDLRQLTRGWSAESASSGRTLVANPAIPTSTVSIPHIKLLLGELGLRRGSWDDKDSMILGREHDEPLTMASETWPPASRKSVSATSTMYSTSSSSDEDAEKEVIPSNERKQQMSPRRRRPRGSAVNALSRRARTFACEACDATFFSRQHLSRHKHIHDVLKPHACPGCPKRFARSDNMKIHSKRANVV